MELLLCKKDSKNFLKAYIKYQEKCTDYIYGEYSFVIYDKKKDFYFAARDPIGLKPLYFVFVDNNVYFAYTIGELIQKSGIKLEVNLQTMKSIVDYSTIPYDETMYKDIKRVPPGHFMKISSDRKYTLTRYWKPEEIKINHKISEVEAEKKFLKIFNDAVFQCIDNIDITGFELSGGLDSSSLVSWIKYQKPDKKVIAFSMNFKSMEYCNESEYIKEIQKKYDIYLINLSTDEMDYKDKYSLENNYKLNPYWPIFITYTMGFSIVEKARELGIKTIITGQGGDHILTGNPYVAYEYFKSFQWNYLYKDIKAANHPKSYIKQYILYPMIRDKNLKWLRYIWEKIKKKDKEEIVNDLSFQEAYENYKGNSISFKYDLAQVTHSTVSALMDSSYYNVAEEHYGVEFKHPFFDRRLIEFMLTLPPKFKYSEGISKRLLRTVMEGILPEKIRQRTDKAEFSEVLRQQIDAIDLDDLFHDTNLVKLGLIDQEKLDKYKEDYLSGKMKRIVYFWQIINLEYWYRFNFVNDQSLGK